MPHVPSKVHRTRERTASIAIAGLLALEALPLASHDPVNCQLFVFAIPQTT
jgi:hypothetical protein